MKEINENTKYIIGIDFGHGETAAALYDIENNIIKQANIFPGNTGNVIPSAIASVNGQSIIGYPAVAEMSGRMSFRVSFKKRPSEMNDEDKQIMIEFMRCVYSNILSNNSLLNGDNHVVCIARPSSSSWDKEEDEYINMAERAGIPIGGVYGIYREARAAYYRARTMSNSTFNNYAKKGILVVDFGSSTIDYTYLNEQKKYPIYDADDLGANAVETALMRDFLDNKKDEIEHIKDFDKLYGHNPKSVPYNKLLFEFRRQKETFYSSINQGIRFSIKVNLFELTSTEEDQIDYDKNIRYQKTENEIRLILRNYIESVRKSAIEFKEKQLKDNKVQFVFLTGGASNMDFVKEIFIDVFNLDKEYIEKEGDASTIVAEGIAQLSYVDYTLENKTNELRNKVKTILDNFDWYKEISTIVYPIVKDDICQEALCIMSDWKKGYIFDDNDNCSINALRKKFRKVFENYSTYDFVQKSRDLIYEQIIQKIIKNIEESFVDYTYEDKPILLQNSYNVNISACLNEEGVSKLISKFTVAGDGNIIFDIVKDVSWGVMVGWDVEKPRSDTARERHYNRYKYDFFSAYEWDNFYKNVIINGIDELKENVTSMINKYMNEYISYACLSTLL